MEILHSGDRKKWENHGRKVASDLKVCHMINISKSQSVPADKRTENIILFKILRSCYHFRKLRVTQAVLNKQKSVLFFPKVKLQWIIPYINSVPIKEPLALGHE